MANNSLRIDNSLSFKPIASAPSDPRPGQLYVDSADDNKLKQYVDNVGWVAIGDVQGAPVTDWVEYPLTIGATTTAPTKGTTVRDKAEWRRVGDTLEVRYNFEQSGAGTAGSGIYLFPLPSGLVIDASKISLGSTSDKASSVGTGSASTAADYGASGRELTLAAYDTTNLMAYIDLGGTFSVVNSGGNGLANANQTYSFYAAVPIVGWSANVTMASDPAALPSAISYYLSANQAVTANVTDIAFDTVISDPKSLYSAGVFTADVAGTYSIITSGSTTTGSIAPILYKNGVATAYLSNWDQVSVKTSAVTVQLAVGDTLSIRSNTTDTIYGQTLANGGSTLSIARITGSTSIAIDNPPAARYTSTSTASITGTASIVDFETKVYDEYNSVTTGASWKFTAPSAGLYQVSSLVMTNSGTNIVNYACELQLFKNGSYYTDIDISFMSTTNGVSHAPSGTASVKLAQGDYIDVRISQGTGNSFALQGTADYAWVEVLKVSN